MSRERKPRSVARDVAHEDIEPAVFQYYADLLAVFPNAKFEIIDDVLRFKSNHLNRWLVDNGVDLNALEVAHQNGAFSTDALMQFKQDLGYSLSGFCELFDDEIKKRFRNLQRAAERAKKPRKKP